MEQYVISVNQPWKAKSYFAAAGGYTFERSSAKMFDSYRDADAQLMVLATANTAVAKYGQVEEA